MTQNETRIAAEMAARRDAFTLCATGFLPRRIAVATALIVKALKSGGQVLVFGNGGSAAEAQHFAAELVGRFKRDRRALPAIALTTDTSILTAQANDAGYETVFARQIEALARTGDVVIGMTTSDVRAGHSANILMGFVAARTAGCATIGLFSEKTDTLLSQVDVPLIVPDTDTSVIQEVHLAILHIISGIVEEEVS
jgi:D-sedoheptulose 7-phosphate isomerase